MHHILHVALVTIMLAGVAESADAATWRLLSLRVGRSR